MIPISVTYPGDLRCLATHGPSKASLTTDAPVDNHGKGESFSPTDLVATALATCMATVIGIKARQKGIAVEGMTVEIEKHMSEDAPRRIVRLPVRISLPLSESHPEAASLKAAALGCPVYQSVHPGIDKPVTFFWES